MLTRFARWVAPARAFFLVCLVLGGAIAQTACAPPLTAANVEEWGTRSYAGATRRIAFRATVGALKSLGYETAIVDEGVGRIKTAPKLLVVHASGSRYGARATGSSLAWDVDVTVAGGAAIIRARPRGDEGGQGVPIERMNAEYVKRMYDALFTEIESNLPAGATHRKIDDPR